MLTGDGVAEIFIKELPVLPRVERVYACIAMS